MNTGWQGLISGVFSLIFVIAIYGDWVNHPELSQMQIFLRNWWLVPLGLVLLVVILVANKR